MVLAGLGGLGIGGCAVCAGVIGGSAWLSLLGIALMLPSLAPLLWLMLENHAHELAQASEPELPEPPIEPASRDDDDTQPFARRGPPPPPPSGVGREAFARLKASSAPPPPPPPSQQAMPLSQRLGKLRQEASG
jgi:hypothetical protein